MDNNEIKTNVTDIKSKQNENTAKVEPHLNTLDLYHLVQLEEEAELLAKNELGQAQQQLNQLQQQVQQLQNEVIAIQGAVRGAHYAIQNKLTKLGVSLETYQKQKAELAEPRDLANTVKQ